jgi:hypothetical protein
MRQRVASKTELPHKTEKQEGEFHGEDIRHG